MHAPLQLTEDLQSVLGRKRSCPPVSHLHSLSPQKKDTFCILRKGSTKELLSHLNGIRPTIKFTVEQEEDGALPFLDMLLRRRGDGSLDVSVYRKPTHTDRYLHFESKLVEGRNCW